MGLRRMIAIHDSAKMRRLAQEISRICYNPRIDSFRTVISPFCHAY